MKYIKRGFFTILLLFGLLFSFSNGVNAEESTNNIDIKISQVNGYENLSKDIQKKIRDKFEKSTRDPEEINNELKYTGRLLDDNKKAIFFHKTVKNLKSVPNSNINVDGKEMNVKDFLIKKSLNDGMIINDTEEAFKIVEILKGVNSEVNKQFNENNSLKFSGKNKEKILKKAYEKVLSDKGKVDVGNTLSEYGLNLQYERKPIIKKESGKEELEDDEQDGFSGFDSEFEFTEKQKENAELTTQMFFGMTVDEAISQGLIPPKNNFLHGFVLIVYSFVQLLFVTIGVISISLFIVYLILFYGDIKKEGFGVGKMGESHGRKGKYEDYLIALMITIIILFGGFLFYYRFVVEKPVEDLRNDVGQVFKTWETGNYE